MSEHVMGEADKISEEGRLPLDMESGDLKLQPLWKQGYAAGLSAGEKERDKLAQRVKVLEEALERIIGMCGEVNRCQCGRPTGIPALVSCARTALEEKP